MMEPYGEETKKALKNFPFSTHLIRDEFLLSAVKIKKASALANLKFSNLPRPMARAIVSACDEILSGKHPGAFPLASLQGGAGTASHMNINEVVARRATSILNGKMNVHPNNHVNLSQSTNDVNPSALKLALFELLSSLDQHLAELCVSLERKAREFESVKKLGRTHLQDAVPTTLGAEFKAYALNVKKHFIRLKEAKKICLILNLGGTAIGNSINASPQYIREVYKELNKITKGRFQEAKNKMAQTGSQTDFLFISHTVTALMVELSKIANDLRFMSSGPRGGIGEIILPELQKGSSIMPGKVNPVMPETVNQLYYLVSGNNLSIEQAVAGAEMELGVMLPLVVDKLIESVKLAAEVIGQFDRLCVRGIKADKERCAFLLEKSSAYATLFVPVLGYDKVSEIVRQAVSAKKTIREIIIGQNLLSPKEFEAIVESFSA